MYISVSNQIFFQTIYAVVMERNIYFSAKHYFESFLFIQPPFGRLHGPFGAGPGLRPVICLAVFSTNPFYKPKTYNYAKTFFIWFITSIKTVSKNTIVEKDTFLFKMAVLKPFVHRPPPSARGSAPSFVSLFSLQPFLG